MFLGKSLLTNIQLHESSFIILEEDMWHRSTQNKVSQSDIAVAILEKLTKLFLDHPLETYLVIVWCLIIFSSVPHLSLLFG